LDDFRTGKAMTQSSIDKSAYAKGYRAGVVKVEREHAAAQRNDYEARELALWQQCFIAAIPACVMATGWTRGKEPINTVQQRMKLAAEFSDHAVQAAKERGKI
jgi:hypothetical protein